MPEACVVFPIRTLSLCCNFPQIGFACVLVLSTECKYDFRSRNRHELPLPVLKFYTLHKIVWLRSEPNDCRIESTQIYEVL